MTRRILATAVVAALAAFGLTGCASTVVLQAAPQATSVACAGIIASVSQLATISGQNLRQTDAQGTAAWGAEPSVTLRCGVQPGVSSDLCTTVDGVDWQYHSDGRFFVITTFGRSPATQVVIDSHVVSNEDILPSISDVVGNETTATKHCSS